MHCVLWFHSSFPLAAYNCFQKYAVIEQNDKDRVIANAYVPSVNHYVFASEHRTNNLNLKRS